MLYIHLLLFINSAVEVRLYHVWWLECFDSRTAGLCSKHLSYIEVALCYFICFSQVGTMNMGITHWIQSFYKTGYYSHVSMQKHMNVPASLCIAHCIVCTFV